MLVNVMPPVLDAPTLREPVIVASPAAPPRGFLVVHPRYRNWLAKCGITSAAAALSLPGEIVSGHANRHVLQVLVKSGSSTRSLFLKREHSVSWRVRLKNWRDGFGRVSRSEREAKVLDQLERAGLPGPHWIAYGEDGDGRAFLLVDELTGFRELRAVLTDTALSSADRGRLAARLGTALAELHAAGFDTPDLAAKHIFVRPGSLSVTVLDWQSTKPGQSLDTMARVQSLACLNASLVEWLATPRERVRMVRAYLQRVKEPHSFASFVRAIILQSRTRLKRSSIRVQRQSNALQHNQRLVWLADEAVCAIPEIAKQWPTPAMVAPFYADTITDGECLSIRLPDDRPATLLRFRTVAPLGRVTARLRGHSWRSPAARLARLLFHLQNAGVEVPQLYAFGQRLEHRIAVDSFLVHGLPENAIALETWLKTNAVDAERVLLQLGALLRTAHDAGCTLGGTPDAIRVSTSRGRVKLILDPTRGGQLVRDLSRSQRIADLAGLLKPLAEPLLSCILDGYSNSTDATARRFAQRVRKQVAA